MKAGTQNYGTADRLLHRLAFRATALQRIAAELEESMFAKQLAAQPVEPPVFITALPRAGTTLMLELLTGSGQFCSYTYADMPFVLCPLLWDLLTRGRRGQANLQERAHGDGVLISHEATEAFEEVVWRAQWPQPARRKYLPLWATDGDAREVRTVLERNLRKVLLLRRRSSPAASRYVSKNNANLARLGVLRRAFPEARLVIPFRRPEDHVASLLNQHRLFRELHGQDAFAAEYMRYLGHDEFGELLTPLDFTDWSATDRALDPLGAEFWFRYWCAATRHVLRHAGDVCLLDYDVLCQDPARTLERLAAGLQMKSPAALVDQARNVRPPRASARAPGDIPDPQPAESAALWAELRDRAVNRP